MNTVILNKIQNMGSTQFSNYIRMESKPIKNYIDAGAVAVAEVEKLFAIVPKPIAYHNDKLSCIVNIKKLGIYGIVNLHRTRYGQTTSYKDLTNNSCYNKASVLIGRAESNKLYFQSFRKLRGQWYYGLQDAKRSFKIHENHQAFTSKEIQLVLDALTRINHMQNVRKSFNSKFPTLVTINI